MAYSTLTATVTALTPAVLILVDGADTPAPCSVTTGLTIHVSDRVTVEDRSPQLSMITGIERTSP
jgi:hypothetical protein